MTPPAQPERPALYHITHIDNLAAICETGALLSDARMETVGGPTTTIGMPHIKARRLRSPVDCHPGDMVGEYVPFNLCPRSVMLYLIHKANHPNLAYRGGQARIIHLEFDLIEVLDRAEKEGGRFVICPGNASTHYAVFYPDRDALDKIDWASVAAIDWTDPMVKEAKQSEVLVYGQVPIDLVRRIGVFDTRLVDQVREAIEHAAPLATIESRRPWYY